MADPTPSSSKRSLFSGWSSSPTPIDSARPETRAGLIPSASASSSTPPSAASPPMPSRKKRELQGWKHSAAGSIGGMAGAIVTSPFDVVKTRLQSDMFRQSAASSLPSSSTAATGAASASRRGASSGLWAFVDTVVLIRRIGVEEGWRALYKGLGPSLVGIIPARAINFYFYPTSKAYLAKRFPNAPTEKAGQTSEDSPLIHLSAAVIAGIMTATGTNPLWVVKTRLQLSAKKTQPMRPTPIASSSTPGPAPSSTLPGPIARSASALAAGASRPAAAATAAPAAAGRRHDALSMTLSIIRQEGLPGLYRGLSASYLGVSEGVIQWVLYERLKRLSNAHPSNPDTKQSVLGYVTGIVGASGGAKAVASLITYPHEVVRTRLRQPAVEGRTKYTGLLQTLKLVAREEGMAGLYGGLTAHMFRVVPNAACMFLIYELVAERLGS